MTLPGRAVGAGGAFTVGVNEPTDCFSVGEGVADALLSDDGALVSAGFSLVVLQAVKEPIPAIAAAPATRATRRDKREDHIVLTHTFPPWLGDGSHYRRPLMVRRVLQSKVGRVRPHFDIVSGAFSCALMTLSPVEV
jgi:hypothetical protein